MDVFEGNKGKKKKERYNKEVGEDILELAGWYLVVVFSGVRINNIINTVNLLLPSLPFVFLIFLMCAFGKIVPNYVFFSVYTGTETDLRFKPKYMILWFTLITFGILYFLWWK